MAVFRYEFVGFTFSLDQGLVFQGRTISLTPKQRQVLDILLACENREISKQVLIDQAWQNEAITDNALYRCIYMLRRALAHADGIEIIATVYNRGFRIAVPVVRVHHLLPENSGRILQTGSIPAFEAWQLAREAIGRRTPADIEAALLALKMSAELDPGYLPAWSGQVECHIVQALRGYLPPREAARRGLLAAQMAQGYCPGLDGDLLAASAWIKAMIEWRFDEGLADLKRAVLLNPMSWKIRYHRAWVLYVLGRSGNALNDLDTALTLNPMAGAAHAFRSWILFCGQRERAALNYLLRATRRIPQDDALQIMLAVVAGSLRRNRLALAAAQRARELSGNSATWQGQFAYVLAQAGKTRDALKALEEAAFAQPMGAPATLLAPAWLALGLPDQAQACLDRARNDHCPWFFANRRDPRLATLATDLANRDPLEDGSGQLPGASGVGARPL